MVEEEDVDPVRELFERFRREGAALIERMVAEGEQETLHLDFKGAARDAAPLQDDDRKTLARAISGFANSDGGVIVWGVDARKGPGPGDPDVAQATKPIASLARWISDLNGYTAHYVQPAVTGVEHLAIPSADTVDAGYAITYVPKSVSSLHMATAKTEQYSYYVRSGSSFVKMEHFMIADRFSRRPAPHLALTLEATPEHKPFIGHRLSCFCAFVVGITNTGRGIGTYPALGLVLGPHFHLLSDGPDGNRQTGLPERPRGARRGAPDEIRFFAGGANEAIYPGTTLEVARIAYAVREDSGDGNEDAAFAAPVILRFELYCDGFAGCGELVLSPENLIMAGVSLLTLRVEAER